MNQIITHECTIAALQRFYNGIDAERIDHTVFHCCDCQLLFTQQDQHAHQVSDDACPRCLSTDLATQAERWLETVADAEPDVDEALPDWANYYSNESDYLLHEYPEYINPDA